MVKPWSRTTRCIILLVFLWIRLYHWHDVAFHLFMCIYYNSFSNSTYNKRSETVAQLYKRKQERHVYEVTKNKRSHILAIRKYSTCMLPNNMIDHQHRSFVDIDTKLTCNGFPNLLKLYEHQYIAIFIASSAQQSRSIVIMTTISSWFVNYMQQTQVAFSTLAGQLVEFQTVWAAPA